MKTELAHSTQQIEVCDWSTDWPKKFAVKAAAIRRALTDHALRIDHIGSTAIQGLAAKPIIDIQISVADLQPIEILTERMATIGCVWRPLNADLTKRYFRERPGDERTHIHVRQLGSWREQWGNRYVSSPQTHSDIAIDGAQSRCHWHLQQRTFHDAWSKTYLMHVSLNRSRLRIGTCGNSKCYSDLCASDKTRGAVVPLDAKRPRTNRGLF